MKNRTPNRRDFLAAGAALLAAGPIVMTQLRAAEAAPGKKKSAAKSPAPDVGAEPAALTQEILDTEVRRSRPDYILHATRADDPDWAGGKRGFNQHVLVFPAPDDSLLALWTQKGGQAHRILFTRSTDGGRTWAPPRLIAGSADGSRPDGSASWAFPVLTARGRLYVFWIAYTREGMIPYHSGPMLGIFSDDLGRTWSEPQHVPLWKSSPFDDPAGKVPPSWVVWQVPHLDRRGRPYVGFQHPVNKGIAAGADQADSVNAVVEFMRFENIDAHPEPRAAALTFHAFGEKALRAPKRHAPHLPLLQEPAIVRLPDGSLFCAMRSDTGYIWFSTSRDDGERWATPRPLLRRDHGEPILSPLNSTPIHQLSDGRYALMHTNHPGTAPADRPGFLLRPRYPWHLALGEFRSGADQPLWFSESKVFLDHGGNLRNHGFGAIGNYGSFTSRRGEDVYWYQDRYLFLLGKRITRDFLADLKVPSA